MGSVWYAAVPADAGLVPGVGGAGSGIVDTSIEKIETITVNGVKYDVWYAGGVTATRSTWHFFRK